MPINIDRFIPTLGSNEVSVKASGADLTFLECDNAETRTCEKPKPGLNFNSLFKPGIKVTKANRISGESYTVTFARKMFDRNDFITLLKKDNPYDSFYDEDIDDNELINKTEQPLWIVTNKGNSFVITRNR